MTVSKNDALKYDVVSRGSVTQLETCYHVFSLNVANTSVEVWRRLVARFVRDEEAGGSNPLTSTSVCNT